jgi:hypothetical protein
MHDTTRRRKPEAACDPLCRQVDMLYGRRVKGVPDSSRWVENYTLPGQCVGLRISGQAGPSAAPDRFFPISSSPYASRRDSATLDGALIEVRAAPSPIN